MPDLAPSRSVILELREERQAMAEGYAFLDEKCLAIAGEIVRELARYEILAAQLRAASAAAARALAAALARHGLTELSRHPTPDGARYRFSQAGSTLMGVRLLAAALEDSPEPPEAPAWSSPEARACAQAFASLVAIAPETGAVVGNLERLSEEYRRSSRRARALNDVLIPEVAQVIDGLETALEDLEREDAIAMRLGARSPR